ncbi:efflux RND transporter periplasmic adaptor subunit [Paramagnetospirillum kuznetsovii]|uniref:Efflux RND transporter periplasmic adaptor subunit n=1 Tax=Paramagnetospirillum kuznetsovii TaxID=2053833 RepID=A0A364P0D5_9PROT|nr:efflux RND transporter periplasmic adaptor subunit [Paramagnetospirillum kuznetsovii]RAU22809.1 efflux RND transporter periplasmic adaptor subunit [Paramagnetospirillum kuznetsovii]
MFNPPLLATAFAAVLSLLSPTAEAHDGIDHGAPPPAAASISVETGFSAEGGSFQAVLVPGGDGRTLLYLADADTNAPVADATVTVEAADWKGSAAPTHGEGVYALAWAPPPEGADVTLVILAGHRDDLLLIQGVRLGPRSASAGAAAVSHWTHWVGGGAIGIGAVAVMLGLSRLRRNRASAILAALSILAAASAQAQTPPGEPVMMSKANQFLLGIRTEKIEPRETMDSVRVVGRVIPDPSGYARIQPSQTARIVADPAFPIPVPGERVRKGQVLAVLEPTLTNLERGDKRSSLSRIESQLAIAENDLARSTALGDLVPVKQVETSRIQVEQLRRERAQIAGTQLGRELLSAPLDGVVTDVHVVPGEVVNPTQALVEVVDPTRLRVEAIIHDLPLAKRVSGAMAATKLLPGQTFALALLGRSPKLDPQDQGIHAIFQVTSDRVGDLSIGMPVDVFLATGATRLSTAVPRDAITELGGRQVVFVRTAPEVFEARPVKLERIVGPLAEISDSVAPGERVVSQGVDQLRAGR